MTTNRYGLQIALATGAGFVVGVLILTIGLNFETIPFIGAAVSLLHVPSDGCAHYWSYRLDLPPHQEAAFVVVPLVAAILQWTLLGLLIGVWRCFALWRKRPKQGNEAEQGGLGHPPQGVGSADP